MLMIRPVAITSIVRQLSFARALLGKHRHHETASKESDGNFKSYSYFEIETPFLLLSLDRMKKNCHRVLELATKYNLNLRPHVKTLKTVQGAFLMTGGSSSGIVVSTLKEAEFFADAGFQDILYGRVFHDFELHRCAKLNNSLPKFHMMVDSNEHVELLKRHSCSDRPWSVFVKIDCGYNRAGIMYNSDAIKPLVEKINKEMKFSGLYVHCGNSYDLPAEARKAFVADTINKLMHVVNSLKESGVAVITYGIGSTPSLAVDIPELFLITEIHAGNYITSDLQQVSLNSCEEDDIAMTVCSRVIGRYPVKNQLLIDCGYTALTKEKNPNANHYGKIKNYPNLLLTRVTQEIGIVEPKTGEINFEDFPIGTILEIYPWHACATANMFSEYYVSCGNRIVDKWIPADARG